MTDVSKIPGAGPPQPAREPTRPGTEKFKELMKVGDSEKRQKKRQKRRDESEEELKAGLRSTPPDKDIEGAKKPSKTPKIQQVGESEKRQPQKQKRPEEAVPEAVKEEGIAREKVSQIEIESELADLEKKFAILAETRAQSTSKETAIEEEETKVEEKEEVTTKEEVKKVVVQQEITQAAIAPSSTLGPSFIAPPSETPPAYATLSTDILALFDRMVGVIAVMKDSGITETIIHLNTAEFSQSKFAGSEIVIREYSTAPLAYNIELRGTAQNTVIFERNIGSLMQAFNTGNYNFRVNRIETRISQRPDKPLFHRKEPPPEKQKE